MVVCISKEGHLRHINRGVAVPYATNAVVQKEVDGGGGKFGETGLRFT